MYLFLKTQIFKTCVHLYTYTQFMKQNPIPYSNLTYWRGYPLKIMSVFFSNTKIKIMYWFNLLWVYCMYEICVIGRSLRIQSTLDLLFLSHPSLGWLYGFGSFPPRPPPQQLLPLMSKPFQINLRSLGQRIDMSGKMYWMIFPWPWPKVTAVASIRTNLLVCAIKWELLIRSLKTW